VALFLSTFQHNMSIARLGIHARVVKSRSRARTGDVRTRATRESSACTSGRRADTITGGMS
jgi:hypothetical protein